jgi:hypothetical protein
MRRLKHAEVRGVRGEFLLRQGNLCDLCKTAVQEKDAVLDHDHRTGAVRGVLHRGCNSLLGKLENNAARYGVRDIGVFANGVASYLRRHMTNVTGLLHPTHKSDDEKAELRRKKAREYRRRKKEQPSI